MMERKAWWIGGTATAFLGLALLRLLAPELAGAPAMIAAATGYLLVAAGITILALATRRKPEEAFIAVDKDAGERERL